MKIVWFCHGKESGPTGIKIQRLGRIARQRGWQVRALDFRATHDPEQRIAMLTTAWRKERAHRAVLVGSSMGGYVAAIASRSIQPEALLLLAPAVGLGDYAESAPVVAAQRSLIVHGWDDDVVPADNVIAYAQGHRLPLQMLAAGHDLHAALDELDAAFARLLNALSPENSRLLSVL